MRRHKVGLDRHVFTSRQISWLPYRKSYTITLLYNKILFRGSIYLEKIYFEGTYLYFTCRNVKLRNLILYPIFIYIYIYICKQIYILVLITHVNFTFIKFKIHESFLFFFKS